MKSRNDKRKPIKGKIILSPRSKKGSPKQQKRRNEILRKKNGCRRTKTLENENQVIRSLKEKFPSSKSLGVTKKILVTRITPDSENINPVNGLREDLLPKKRIFPSWARSSPSLIKELGSCPASTAYSELKSRVFPLLRRLLSPPPPPSLQLPPSASPLLSFSRRCGLSPEPCLPLVMRQGPCIEFEEVAVVRGEGLPTTVRKDEQVQEELHEIVIKEEIIEDFLKVVFAVINRDPNIQENIFWRMNSIGAVKLPEISVFGFCSRMALPSNQILDEEVLDIVDKFYSQHIYNAVNINTLQKAHRDMLHVLAFTAFNESILDSKLRREVFFPTFSSRAEKFLLSPMNCARILESCRESVLKDSILSCGMHPETIEQLGVREYDYQIIQQLLNKEFINKYVTQ